MISIKNLILSRISLRTLLFNIDLLNPNSNQYGGVPTVLGNDISISSDQDSLLIAVDLQLSFSEVGKADINDFVSGYYADADQLPTQPILEQAIRSMIDTFISEGHNLDLWFGLGEQDLSVYASDTGGNFPQDHHDALVRYGQSDGFNADPPPQSIWPTAGAQDINIEGLIADLATFANVDGGGPPPLGDGSPDFAQLDFSGKIVLPTLTYGIEPEPNTPDTGTGITRLVAVRSQDGVYALDYDADTFTNGSPFVNPQYAAVDVQSVSLQLLNNNEDNDPQQGENNMSTLLKNKLYLFDIMVPSGDNWIVSPAHKLLSHIDWNAIEDMPGLGTRVRELSLDIRELNSEVSGSGP